jgi:hypothetical protein
LSKINIGTPVDLEKLIETRLLIQANSGGGKSYAIRKLLEETNGKVQQIVLDLEGEFATLREKCDFVIFGKDADYPVNIRYAEKTARSLLELNASAIIDLYELKQHERILFVKRFLEAMINAPSDLWHACLVVIDEAHIFCPQAGQAESMSAVIDLCTRGRKRGYCAVLATQRLSKLAKDAAAECNNKLIGRTGLDVDMKRVADELGFSSKQDILALRTMGEGMFHAFGPAISNEVIQFKVGEVKTTHRKTGQRFIAVPAASEKVKAMLLKIKDLPAEAEKEIKELADYKEENAKLKRELSAAKRQTPVVDNSQAQKLKGEVTVLKADVNTLRNEKNLLEAKALKAYKNGIVQAAKAVQEALKNIEPMKMEGLQEAKVYTKPLISPNRLQNSEKNAKVFTSAKRVNFENEGYLPEKITKGAMKMLKAAAMFHPNEISRARIGAIAGLSYKSGTFGTYIAKLKSARYITGEGKMFAITEEGLTVAGEVEPLPTDPESLVNIWCDIVKGGAARMLKVLYENHPNAISRQELGEAAKIIYTSGTFGTYMAKLKSYGLIETSGKQVKLSDELFGEV